MPGFFCAVVILVNTRPAATRATNTVKVIALRKVVCLLFVGAKKWRRGPMFFIEPPNWLGRSITTIRSYKAVEL